MVLKFKTNCEKFEEVIAKKQGLTGSEIHSKRALECCYDGFNPVFNPLVSIG